MMGIFQGERVNHMTCCQEAEREEARALAIGLSKLSVTCDPEECSLAGRWGWRCDGRWGEEVEMPRRQSP